MVQADWLNESIFVVENLLVLMLLFLVLLFTLLERSLLVTRLGLDLRLQFLCPIALIYLPLETFTARSMQMTVFIQTL